MAKGAAKAVTSKPAKAAGSMAAKGAAAAGKAAVGGVKKLAKRLSTTGRADAAAKKANAIAKRTAERERLAKEKERVAKERERAKKSGRADQRSAVADKQKELDKAAQKRTGRDERRPLCAQRLQCGAGHDGYWERSLSTLYQEVLFHTCQKNCETA